LEASTPFTHQLLQPLSQAKLKIVKLILQHHPTKQHVDFGLRFQNWQPLEESRFGLDVFGDAKALLDDAGSSAEPGDNVYYQLIWDCWMPRLRAAVSIWEPRKCEKLLAIFEAWQNLVPQACWQHILEAVVLPKLQVSIGKKS
jgi:hypothetical protein